MPRNTVIPLKYDKPNWNPCLVVILQKREICAVFRLLIPEALQEIIQNKPEYKCDINHYLSSNANIIECVGGSRSVDLMKVLTAAENIHARRPELQHLLSDVS